MLNLNTQTLAAVVEKATHDAANHPRWLVAIGRAIVELESNPYLERQDGHLLIGSPSGATYAANGTCSCTAFEFGHACWHRAAARLVRLCDEATLRQRDAARDARLLDQIAQMAPTLSERLAKARADMAELFA